MLDKKDNKQYLYSLSPLAMLPLGMKDAINPFAISSFLLFIILLFYYGRDLPRAIGNGFLFIIVLMAGTSISIIGMNYDARTYIIFNNTIFLINWIIAVLMIIFGMLLFVDWIRMRFFKKTDTLFIKIPFFATNATEDYSVDDRKGKNNMKSGLISFVFVVFFGIMASFNNATWAQDSGIYMVFLNLLSSAKYLQFIAAIFLYDIAFVFPMLLVLLAVSVLLYNKKFYLVSRNTVSLIRVIFSAVYLAVGLGLVYIMLM